MFKFFFSSLSFLSLPCSPVVHTRHLSPFLSQPIRSPVPLTVSSYMSSFFSSSHWLFYHLALPKLRLSGTPSRTQKKRQKRSHTNLFPRWHITGQQVLFSSSPNTSLHIDRISRELRKFPSLPSRWCPHLISTPQPTQIKPSPVGYFFNFLISMCLV